MTAPLFEVAIVTLLGLAAGSFLNVVIHRLPRKESIVSPGSRCPACGYALRWYDNIPVLSYAALGGRCRGCRKGISIRYPIVELVTAILFVAHYYVFGWSPLLAVRLLFASAMVALFAIDLEHQLLPDAITLPGIVLGPRRSLFLPPGIVDALLGILVGGGFLWLVAEAYFRYAGEEGMGGGDVKMLAMIGAFSRLEAYAPDAGAVLDRGLRHRADGDTPQARRHEARAPIRHVPRARRRSPHRCGVIRSWLGTQDRLG